MDGCRNGDDARAGGIQRNGINRNEQQHDANHSPESAGLARGLARSAASRAAVGRLPLPPPPRPNASGAIFAKSTRSSANIARIRKVARVSDRAATGFDVVAEAHSAVSATNDTTDSSTAAKDTRRRPLQSLPYHSGWNFLKGLAKNTILGTAVFGAYEEIIDRVHVNWNRAHDATSANRTQLQMNSFPLATYYGAGFCAGGIHAILSRSIEGVSSAVARTNTTIRPSPFLPFFLHHATSHAVLFGSYETIKFLANQTSTETIKDTTSIVQPNMEIAAIANDETAHDDDGDSVDDGVLFVDSRLMTVGLAGGIAGVSQQIISDWMEQIATKLVRVSAKGATPTTRTTDMGLLWNAITTSKFPRYSLRTLGMTFFPTSIGFVAFEYGREAVAGND